ncbi:MAG: hypothetical protein Q7S16_03375 [bacterium]|nr:hypothetical protein [bacterium]
MKQKQSLLLFILVGFVMVGVLVLWFFSFRETLHEVQEESTTVDLSTWKQQLRQPLQDITKSFTTLQEVVRQIPKTGSLPPDAVANIEKKLQEQNIKP